MTGAAAPVLAPPVGHRGDDFLVFGVLEHGQKTLEMLRSAHDGHAVERRDDGLAARFHSTELVEDGARASQEILGVDRPRAE